MGWIISSANEWEDCCVCVCVCVCARLCLTLRNFMDCSPSGSSVHGFPKQEYWSGLPWPSPGDLLNPGIEPWSLAGGFFTASATWEALKVCVPCVRATG